MLLNEKVAVIYGAGGPIGGTIARAFAREGATVYLSGRIREKLEPVAADITSAGGRAQVEVVDALDEAAVDSYVDRVAAEAGGIDISVNVIGYGDIQQPLQEISVDDFLQPIVRAMRSHFLTTRAAARHMVARGGGVVLAFGGGGPQTLPGLGGFKVALDAIEGHRRQWAIEMGEHGIRFITIKTGGIPESIPESAPWRRDIEESIVGETFLKRAATLDDVGNVAVFAASDHARMITSTEINISGGAMPE